MTGPESQPQLLAATEPGSLMEQPRAGVSRQADPLLCNMRFASTAKVLAKYKLKYCRILKCYAAAWTLAPATSLSCSEVWTWSEACARMPAAS